MRHDQNRQREVSIIRGRIFSAGLNKALTDIAYTKLKKVGNPEFEILKKKKQQRLGKSDRAFLENIQQLVDRKYYSG